ncbi:MAG TPA: hypothetical protein VI248_01335 [Kineosporiaceae bacterium]
MTVNHRIIHYAFTRARPRLLALALAALGLLLERFLRSVSGIEIANRAHLGPGLLFAHEGGIVVGPVRTGRHCTISHGVTLGRGLLDGDGPSYADTPVLGDRVWIGPGAVVAGRLNVGSDAAVGANSVVLRDVPPRGVVLGVPARLISRKGSFTQVFYRGMDDDPERLAALREVTPSAPAVPLVPTVRDEGVSVRPNASRSGASSLAAMPDFETGPRDRTS